MGGILYLIFGIVELLVGLRFVFLLLGADTTSNFVTFIYHLSSPLVAPFAGIFGGPTDVTPGLGGTFEWASLVALVVYGLVGTLVGRVAGSARHQG